MTRIDDALFHVQPIITETTRRYKTDVGDDVIKAGGQVEISLGMGRILHTEEGFSVCDGTDTIYRKSYA